MAVKYKTLIVEFRNGKNRRNREMLEKEYECIIVDTNQVEGYFISIPENRIKELEANERIGSIDDLGYSASKKQLQ